jgi:predicted RNA binding protein YcfA (HicA-like mRNA interferase family)
VRLHDLERLLRRCGFRLAYINGSHRTYFDAHGRRFVCGVHPGREVRRGTAEQIARRLCDLTRAQAGK